MAPRVIAVLEEDLQSNALGLPSRAAVELQGEPLLRATVRGLLEYAQAIESVAIVSPTAARPTLSSLLSGLPVSFHDPEPPAGGRERLLRARKWALSSWRSGLGFVSVFDEWGTPKLLQRVLAETGAQFVVKPSALNPLVDGEILDDLVRAAQERGADSLFLPGPPGYAAEIYHRRRLEELREGSTHALLQLATYKSHREPNLSDCFFLTLESLLEGRFRVSADSKRGLEMVQDLRGAIDPGPRGFSARGVEDHLLAHPELWHRRLPRELEIEVTGRANFQHEFLPRPRRNVSDLPIELFARIVEEFGSYDDSLLTFRGHGEPLLHPDLVPMIERARRSGVWGIHVETDGLLLEGNLADLLSRPGLVDVITVRVEAATPEVYRRVTGAHGFDRVVANLEAFLGAPDSQRARSRPLVAVEMTKCRETVREMEAFCLRWAARSDWIVLRPFDERCGQIEDRSALPLYLSSRSLCQKLQNVLVVHADGAVPVCVEDYLGRWPAGNVAHASLESIWTGPMFTALRQAHREDRFDAFPLCAPCRYWHSV